MEPDLDARFREFLGTVKKMAEESAREAERHVAQDEASLEFSFHDGQTGSLGLAVDHLNELARKGSPVSANKIEEAYLGLLLSYKRMKGSLLALERILRAMQTTFELPSAEEVEAGEQGRKVPGK